MAVNLHATHFRFGIDELAENTHGWHAAEDVNPAQGSIAVGVTFLLRFCVQETGGTAAGNADFQFQYNLNGAGWVNITTTSPVVKAVAAAALTNGGNCTKRLSGTGTFESSGAGQTEDGTSGGNANDIAASGCSETECGLQVIEADTNPSDSIQFRLTSPDFTITNDVVPTFTVASAPAQGVTGAAIGSSAALFAATLALTVAGATVTSGATLFAPTLELQQGLSVTGAFIGSGATTTAPALTYLQVLTAATIGGVSGPLVPSASYRVAGATIVPEGGSVAVIVND